MEISRELRLYRKVVRKALRSDKTAFAYKRQHQPRPQLDGHIARLNALLAEELAKPKRERLNLTRLFERLRAEGYVGGYDAVHRYAQRWFAEHVATAAGVFVRSPSPTRRRHHAGEGRPYPAMPELALPVASLSA